MRKQMMMHRGPLFFLLAIFVVLYLQYTLKTNDVYEILQLSPSRLTYERLKEKLPIVVELRGNTPDDIIKHAMRYMYLYQSQSTLNLKPESEMDQVVPFTQNNHAFAVVICPEDCHTIEVEIIHSKYSGDSNYQSISVLLKTKKTCLILPYRWGIRLAKNNKDDNKNLNTYANIIYLHGFMTDMVNMFVSRA
jgi:hypothetical protein